MSHAVGTVLVDAVLTGRARAFRGEETSAIDKSPVHGARPIGFLGIDGDEQADLTVHGGVDKAIHHYPRDHYPFWTEALGPHALLDAPGAFGENISTAGLVEGDVCIGDRFRLGTALVEISQGRQPCWKLGHRFDISTVPATVVTTRRGGWYYRVIEDGTVAAGDALDLIDRPLPEWSVERAFHLLIAGGGKREPAALRALAGMPVLATSWRMRAERLLG